MKGIPRKPKKNVEKLYIYEWMYENTSFKMHFKYNTDRHSDNNLQNLVFCLIYSVITKWIFLAFYNILPIIFYQLNSVKDTKNTLNWIFQI